MNLKKFFLSLVSVVLFFLVGFAAAIFLRYHSWTIDPRPAQKLTAYFSKITKSDFQYQSLRWRLLPFPGVRFSEPVFRFKSELKHELRADSLELKLDLVKLILGEIGFSGLRLKEGEWRGQLDAPKGVHDFLIEHIDLKTGALDSGRPVKVYMSGDAGGRRKAVVIHGILKLPPLEAPSLDSLGFEVQVLTRNFKFEDSPEWEFLGWIPQSGVSDFLIGLKHAPLSDRIEFSGDSGLRDLSFRDADQPGSQLYKIGNLVVKFAGYFSPKTDELKFTQCSAALPFAQFNLQGGYLPHRREFRSLTVSFTELKLDDLPARFPELKNRIPYFIGFSGIADASLSFSGFPDRLKVYGDFNLTRALFTYGRFFQKPKEKPFRLKSDMEWTQEKLAGDFSGNFEALTFKGNLPEWKPSGDIKINMLTNAFAAEQLTGFVPFLNDYDFGGSMKLFASFEGNLQSGKPLQKMFHMSLEKARILRKGAGAGLQNIDLDFDFGPLMVEGKNLRFSIGGAEFSGAFKGIHPEKNLVWEGKIAADKLVPADVLKEWSGFWGGKVSAADSMPSWLRPVAASSEPFEAFEAGFTFQNGIYRADSFKMRALEGSLLGTAAAEFDQAGSNFQISLQGAGLNAAKLFKPETGMEGKLSFTTELEGSHAAGTDTLAWEGPVKARVTNGTFNGFDYVKALSGIEVLKADASASTGPLKFEELNIAGAFKRDHFLAEDIHLQNPDLKVRGGGEIGRDGSMDLRLRTSLTAEHFRQLFPKRADDVLQDQNEFGPVTLLLSGNLAKPEVKPDPQAVADIAGRIARKKSEALSRYL